MIVFKNVHVTFHRGTAMEKEALRGIDIKIKKGEFVSIIGTNGAGKSTLLNGLCGDFPISNGNISVDGLDITDLSPCARSSMVARVFQDPMAGTCANLTIAENLSIARYRGKKRLFGPAVNKQDLELFKKQISRLNLGLENRLNDPIGLLSGGQRQAVSLIMAVLNPMKILVLDEHTAALDPKTADFILKLTREIIEERHLTSMMVTHSMHQALEMGTRTIMLSEGRVIFDIEGKDRAKLKVQDLLDLFHKASGSDLDDDRLLLS